MPTLTFACPGCGKTYTKDRGIAGMMARCKQCSLVFQIPVPGQSFTSSTTDALPAVEEPVDQYSFSSESEAPVHIPRPSYVPPKPTQPARKSRAAANRGLDWAKAGVILGGIVGILSGGVLVLRMLGGGQPSGAAPALARPFESKDGNFHVRFPSEPQKKEESRDTPIGKMRATIFAVRDNDGRVFSVTLSDFPEAALQRQSTQDRLDGGIKGMRGMNMWEVQDERPITLNGGHPGRAFTLADRGPDAHSGRVPLMRGRIYVVGNRYYQLLAGGPIGLVPDSDAEAFLKSFDLIRPVVAGPEVAQASPPAAQPKQDPPVDVPPKPASEPAPPQAPNAGTSAGGASIVDFQWLDDRDDLIGGRSHKGEPDGEPDQHFRLTLQLPNDTTLESMILTGPGGTRFESRPHDFYWPLCLRQNGRAVTNGHVERIGTFSGDVTFDLYGNSGIGQGAGTPFEIQVEVTVGGQRHVLSARCKRP